MTIARTRTKEEDDSVLPLRFQHRHVTATETIAGVLCLAIAPATAAVNECLDELTGEHAEAKTEVEAKRLALQDWLAKAKAIGPGYTRWQLAHNRRIDCRRPAPGAFRCQAIALPCMIKQVPSPGTIPLPRGQ